MKKIVTACIGLLLIIPSVRSQTGSSCWISFSDKKDSPYSLDRPEAFLSEKSILRRKKQNIPLRESDLPVNPDYLVRLKKTGISIISISKWMNAVSITNADPVSLQKIRSLPFVKEVREFGTGAPAAAPDKFLIEQVPSFAAIPDARSFNYGPSFFQADQIGAVCMHDLGFRGQGITIAVLDAGFFRVDSLLAFDSLRMENRLLGCRDFVSGDTMVFENSAHGMNVLSCMAGNLPSKIVGTAPEASYWLLRTEDASSETMQEEINWLIGAEFADSVGADMINSSLGYSYFDDPGENHTYADMDGNTTIVTIAADMAAEKGMLVCASAGNSGGPPWYKITAPADADSVLTVGAVDSAGLSVSFSSRGLTFDGRIKPDVVARGYQATVAIYPSDVIPANGTSFSSPIMAGAAACLWQAHPSRSNMEILQAIRQTASQSASPDSIMGYGIPNMCAAHAVLTGIDEQESADLISIYPNPFTDELSVSFFSSEKQTVLLQLSDISGRMVQGSERAVQPGINHLKLPADRSLSSGIYIFSLSANNAKLYKKVIKD